MARPTKEGLEYFPLDVDMDQDDKIALIEAQHGVTGFAIVVKLLMKIYKNGYFYQWTEKEQLLLSRNINVNINSVNEVVSDCIKWGLFSEEMHKAYSILTSKGIQERYFSAVTRRQKVVISNQFLLLSETQVNEYKNISVKGVNVNSNDCSMGVNDDTGTQSKVKESKVKESIYIVFDYWISKKIINHKTFTDKTKSHIQARLKEYSLDEVQKAIDNYAKVLFDNQYYWTHKWTLQDFMKPNNLIRFLDESDPLKVFQSSSNSPKSAKGNAQVNFNEYV